MPRGIRNSKQKTTDKGASIAVDPKQKIQLLEKQVGDLEKVQAAKIVSQPKEHSDDEMLDEEDATARTFNLNVSTPVVGEEPIAVPIKKVTKPKMTGLERQAYKLAMAKKGKERFEAHRQKVANMNAEETTQYREMIKRKVKETKSKTQAGLIFPVVRIRKSLRKATKYRRTMLEAGIFTAAVLEYMTAEVLELSGNCSKEHGRKRITPRHIMLSIRADEEINKMIPRSTQFRSGGVPLKRVPICLAKNGVNRKFWPSAAALYDAENTKSAELATKENK